MNPESTRAAVERVLADCGPVIVACSGGIDSLLLATIAHRRSPAATVVAHTVVCGQGEAALKERVAPMAVLSHAGICGETARSALKTPMMRKSGP